MLEMTGKGMAAEYRGSTGQGDGRRAPWLYTVVQSWPAVEKQCVLWMAELQKRDCPSLWTSEDHECVTDHTLSYRI